MKRYKWKDLHIKNIIKNINILRDVFIKFIFLSKENLLDYYFIYVTNSDIERANYCCPVHDWLCFAHYYLLHLYFV